VWSKLVESGTGVNQPATLISLRPSGSGSSRNARSTIGGRRLVV
jgi:hypothetical protein